MKYNFLSGLNRCSLMPYFEGDGGGSGGGTPPANPPQDPPALSFDDFLKDKNNQAEFDRRMNKGIQTAVANERARLEALADERVSEAEKLSKMTDLEKQAYQQKKEAEKIAQRERDITKRELTAEAKNTLTEKGLPLPLAEILDYSDAEKCNASIAIVEEAFKKAVEAGVEEKLKGGKPPKDVPPPNDEAELEKQILQMMR